MHNTFSKIRKLLKEETPAGHERPRITAVEALLCEEIDALHTQIEQLHDRLCRIQASINNLKTSEHQE